MPQPKSFTIDRRKWARNGRNGYSNLLNEEGNRCCLGFYLKACGVPDEKMEGIAMPSGVDHRNVPLWLNQYAEGDKLSPEDTIAGFNDNAFDSVAQWDAVSLTDDEIEAAVAMAFAGYGITVKFVGPKP